MIQITFYKDKQDSIKQLLMTGHAGFADPGYDIVCAAVSSQVISVENSLSQLLNIPLETEVNEVEGGYLKIRLASDLDSNLDKNAQLLLSHLQLAFEVLEEAYPEFIQIIHKDYNP